MGVNIHGIWVGTRQGSAIVSSNPANMSNVITPGPDAMQFVAAGEAYAINAGGSFLTRPETDWYSQMFATLPAGHQHLLHYKDPDTGTLRAWEWWNNLLAPGGDYTITMVHSMNDHLLATATVIHNPTGQNKQALLVPVDIKEVASDQINDSDCNKLPTVKYAAEPNNPMLMATRIGVRAHLAIKVDSPKDCATRFMSGHVKLAQPQYSGLSKSTLPTIKQS